MNNYNIVEQSLSAAEARKECRSFQFYNENENLRCFFEIQLKMPKFYGILCGERMKAYTELIYRISWKLMGLETMAQFDMFRLARANVAHIFPAYCQYIIQNTLFCSPMWHLCIHARLPTFNEQKKKTNPKSFLLYVFALSKEKLSLGHSQYARCAPSCTHNPST